MSREEYELWRAPVGSDGNLSKPGKILFSGEAACRRINGYMPSECLGADDRSPARRLVPWQAISALLVFVCEEWRPHLCNCWVLNVCPCSAC
jgi:hypothetical protein